MINAKKIIYICITLVILILIIVIGVLIGQIQELKQSPIILRDTIVETKYLDTLKIQIAEQKENIDNYKKDYEKEKINVYNMSDSNAVKLFFELASE